MFKKILNKIKNFFKDDEPVKLWCGYYGNRQYLHIHYQHEKKVTEVPGEFNRFLKETNYCHEHRVFEERTILFTSAK